MSQMSGAISWISAWIVTILLLIMISRTGWGRSIVYYLAWLVVTFLVVTHYKEISALFAAGNDTGNL